MSRGPIEKAWPVQRARNAVAPLVLVALMGCVDSASAQLFQWKPEQLIKYTAKNPYDHFPDGRPKVPDELLARLKGLIAEPARLTRSAEWRSFGSHLGQLRRGLRHGSLLSTGGGVADGCDRTGVASKRITVSRWIPG
jgi:hypothetical protein